MTLSPIAEHSWTLTAGAGSTVAMMAAGRLTHSPVMTDLHELTATVAARPGSALGAALGHGIQLLNGAVFAECYRALFDSAGLEPSPAKGAAIGLAHGVVAGLALAAVPPLHPRVPEQIPAPGAFLHRRGSGSAAGLIMLHALYGAVVGAALAALRSRRNRRIQRQAAR